MTAAYSLGRLNYAYADKLYSAGGTRICNLIIPFMGSKDVNLIAVHVLEPNARRLAACWNAFEGYSTKSIEKLPALKQFVREQDQQLSTARALLKEVYDHGEGFDLHAKIEAFLSTQKPQPNTGD